MPWTDAAWRRVVVYGLGASGRAAVGLLRERGIAVVGVDERAEVEACCGVEQWILGEEDPGLPTGVDAVILSPGVPGTRLLVREARAAGLCVLSEVELAFPFLEGPVVGVTGSNGKSTVASMTAAILRAAGFPVELCGNIGTPLSSRVEGPCGRIFVVELSSFQLEDVSLFSADSAALLNLSPDHLDRYPSYDAYVAAKTRIFERQAAGTTAVLNAEDDGVLAIGRRLDGPRVRWFSRLGEVNDGCHQRGDTVVEVVPGEDSEIDLFSESDLRVSGVHNLENAMAAALLARSRGANVDAIRSGLAAFEGLPHRLEKVRDHHGVAWFDDSKGTNVGATRKSLEGFSDGSVHLILGGRGKGADPAVLTGSVRRKARHLYFIGESAREFERALGHEVPSDLVGTLELAIRSAARNAVAGEVVLLSPACSSFDQFDSFAHRGDCFQALVNALNGGTGGQEASL